MLRGRGRKLTFRSPIEIAMDILRVCSAEPQITTRITSYANLCSVLTWKYLRELQHLGYVVEIKPEDSKKKVTNQKSMFQTSKEGHRILEQFADLIKAFRVIREYDEFRSKDLPPTYQDIADRKISHSGESLSII
jgi:predicted transcriptional regulator